MNNHETESNNLTTALNELAKGKNRPMTARLKELMPEIEGALQAGARRKDIHQVLVSNGFDGLTFEVFEALIYRIRKSNNEPKAQQHRPTFPAAPQKSPQSGNPLSSLSSKPQPQVFSPIPSKKIEIEP